MKTANLCLVRISIVLVLLLQLTPIKAMATAPAFALPTARAGDTYEFAIRTEGGQPPFRWSVVEGELPPGIELHPSGRLLGTPIAARPRAYEFTLQVSDSSQPSQTYTQTFALVITPSPLRIVMSAPTLKIVDPKIAYKPLADLAVTRRDLTAQREDSAANVAGKHPRSANEGRNSNPSKGGAARGAGSDGDLIKICGKLRPASLDRTLAFISSVPQLRHSKLIQKINEGRLESDETCDELSGYEQGTQKELVVQLLEFVLVALQDSKTEGKAPDLEGSLASIERSLTRQAKEDKKGPLSPDEWSLEKDLLSSAVGHLKLIKQSESFDRLSEGTIRKQIHFINAYLGNVQVQVKDKDGKVVATAFTDKDGNYIAYVPSPTAKAPQQGSSNAKKSRVNNNGANDASVNNGSGDDGAEDGSDNNERASNAESTKNGGNEAQDGPQEFVLSTEADNYRTERRVLVRGNNTQGIRVNIPIEDRPVSLLTRAVVGYQQAAAASSDFEQNYFFDIFIRNSFPVPQKIDADFGERFQLWGAVRVASVPQAGTATIGETASGGFITQVKGLKLNETARVFDLLSGVEFRLTQNRALLPSFARDTKQNSRCRSSAATASLLRRARSSRSASSIFLTNCASAFPPKPKGRTL